MSLDLDKLRFTALVLSGRPIPAPRRDSYGRCEPRTAERPGSLKLPADFHMELFFHGARYLILTETEAKARALAEMPLSRYHAVEAGRRCATVRPHRILQWCTACLCWQYAGKFPQHARGAAHLANVAIVEVKVSV